MSKEMEQKILKFLEDYKLINEEYLDKEDLQNLDNMIDYQKNRG